MEDIRILLVEESSALRKIVSAYLGQFGWAVDHASSFAEAREKIAQVQPDVAIVSQEHSDELLAFLNELDQQGIDAVVASESARVQDRIACFEQGAADFMNKPLDLREVVLRLKRLWRGRNKAALPTSMEMPCGGAVLDIASRVLRKGAGRPVPLTPSEFRLLFLLLRNDGRIVDRTLIARDVLGHNEVNVSRSVDVMVSKLRRKLALAESGRFVRNVRSEGYVLVPEGRERMRGESPDDNPAIA